MSVSKRIKLLLANQNLNQSEFARVIDVPQGTMSSLLSRDGGVNDGILANIMRTYPNLNPRWLILGEGEMFSDENPTNKQPPIEHKNKESWEKENELLREVIKSKERELESKNEIIELLKAKK